MTSSPTSPRTVKVTVNGRTHELPRPLTVRELLDHLGLDDRQCAVERNTELVVKARYDEVRAEDGDTFEIVTFFGGG